MTLKDWKKISSNVYTHKQGIALITIADQKNRFEMSVVKYKPSNTINAESSYFNTKSQALKYAKSYMRKH